MTISTQSGANNRGIAGLRTGLILSALEPNPVRVGADIPPITVAQKVETSVTSLLAAWRSQYLRSPAISQLPKSLSFSLQPHPSYSNPPPAQRKTLLLSNFPYLGFPFFNISESLRPSPSHNLRIHPSAVTLSPFVVPYKHQLTNISYRSPHSLHPHNQSIQLHNVVLLWLAASSAIPSTIIVTQSSWWAIKKGPPLVQLPELSPPIPRRQEYERAHGKPTSVCFSAPLRSWQVLRFG